MYVLALVKQARRSARFVVEVPCWAAAAALEAAISASFASVPVELHERVRQWVDDRRDKMRLPPSSQNPRRSRTAAQSMQTGERPGA
jgi:hypothetical protein